MSALDDEIDGLQEELIEVKNDKILKNLFNRLSTTQFWTKVSHEKKLLGGEAVKILIPFATTYLCEQGFSALATIKTKHRNRLQPEHGLRLALSNVPPRMEDLVSASLQFQPSH